jgi:membrane protein YqaA with SNARE-associated domain
MTDLSEANSSETSATQRDTGTGLPPLPSLVRMGVRIAIGLLVLIAGVFVVGKAWRPELEALSRGFVDSFGFGGMLLGALLADGFHFPIPPQFYLLLGITSGVSALKTMLAVNLGSFVGAWLAYLLAARVSKFGPIHRRLEQARRVTDAVFTRYGAWSVIVASLMPITYSALCYLAGLGRLPRYGFFLITLFRVPRLVAYYYLLKLGWSFV